MPSVLSCPPGMMAPPVSQVPTHESAEAKPASKTYPPEQSILHSMLWGQVRHLCASCYTSLEPNERIYAMVSGRPCQMCPIHLLKPEGFTTPFCDFLTNSPTTFHAVSHFKCQLSKAGFSELSARDRWDGKLEAGGRYYVTRNGTSLIAFTVGPDYEPGNGVAMVAGHIDALTAKLKPHSVKPMHAGYVELGVAQYAGALNKTWWDRDLSIGGRVVLRDPLSGKTTTKLVKVDWPIARIPTLAPHFGVGMMGTNNRESEAVPIIGLETAKDEDVTPLGLQGSFISKQPPKLVQLIASQLRIQDYNQIINWELELFDLQPATVGGMDKEFIFAGRIDDKLCSWAALQSLLLSAAKCKTSPGVDVDNKEGTIKMVALFDDEEIGSLLRQGARGNFLPITVERAVEALSVSAGVPYGPGILGQTYARSFLVSADVTHAIHPNFEHRYLDDHAPKLNVGLCICADSNGHMTTDGVSTAILRRAAEMSGCTTQVFQIRNDSRSGGTIGPALSSAMGVRAADAGLPQLSMHSIRATTGALDPGLGVKFFKGFLDNWERIDEEWC